MAPLIPAAKATLSYPLYACDFDPLDSTRLVVGGGGGSGKTGVGNRITLLDTSNPQDLVEAGEIELSKEEDNVTSLAVGARKGNSTLIYAGVNANPNDVGRGKNTHFRVYSLAVTTGKAKGKTAAKFSELAKATLFSGKEKDAYQRVTRLSKPYPNQPQLGAVTTGLAKQSEIVLFDTSTFSPPTSRGSLLSSKEAVDVDFIQTGDKEYLFAYCDEYDIYLKKIAPKTDDTKPECIYITPNSRSPEKPNVPTFRALRFLTKDFIVMLANVAQNSGVVLQIFRIPPSGEGQCRLAKSSRLRDGLTKATGLAVCNLTPPLTPSDPQDYTQFVIALAGHDRSINLYKVNLQVESNVSLVSSIKSFRTFKNVHPLQITGLAFSNFTPPSGPITASTPPQTLKLASVGVSNTVIVHTLPLFPVPLSMKRGQSKTPRYVVALPSKVETMGIFAIVSMVVVALAGIFIQGILEIRGSSPSYLGLRERVPNVWQEVIGRPYEFPVGYGEKAQTITTTAPAATVTQQVGMSGAQSPAILINELLGKLKAGEDHGHDGVVILNGDDEKGGVKAHVHNEEQHGPHVGKTWDNLSEKQKKLWHKRLEETGEWAGGLGSNLFKGVVFSEIAGAIGQAVAGA